MRKRSTIATKPPFKSYAVFDRRDGDNLLLLHGWDGKYPSAKVAAVEELADRFWVRQGEYVVVEWPWESHLEDFAEDLGGRNWRLKPGAEEVVRIEIVTIGSQDIRKSA